MPRETLKKVKSERFQNSVALELRELDEDERTAWVAFSSENPVERWYGYEILDHSERAVRLSRIMDGGPVLLNHDPDKHIGTVEDVRLDADRKLRAKVRFAKSQLAQETMQNIKDKILRHASIGYVVHNMETTREVKNDQEVFRVNDWEPFELTLTPIPADISVGIGRQFERGDEEMTIATQNQETQPKAAIQVEQRPSHEDIRTSEIKRIRAIEQLCAHFDARDLSEQMIRSGLPVEDVTQKLLERMKQSAKSIETDLDESDIYGIPKAEQRDFSLLRCIHAIVENNWSEAGFEREVCQQMAKHHKNRKTGGYLIPTRLLNTRNALLAGVAKSGQELVPTELSGFLPSLRARIFARQLGAQLITGLEGNVGFPALDLSDAAYWIQETVSAVEATYTSRQVPMSPKGLGTYVDISRTLLKQSSVDVEAKIRDDFAAAIARAIDRAIIAGTGTAGQPKGLLSYGDNEIFILDLKSAEVAYPNAVQLETEVEANDADIGTLAYLTNPKLKGIMKLKPKHAQAAAGFMWEESGVPGEGIVNGYRARASTLVPEAAGNPATTLVSSLIYGAWDQILIGEWGVMEIDADKSRKFLDGGVTVRAIYDTDIAIAHTKAFAIAKNIKIGTAAT